MPFRFHAKKLFVTYPQSGELSKERVDEFFSGLGAVHRCVGRERHSDGGFHIHAYIEWTDKFDTKNERAFDIDGNHPNIQPSRNSNACKTYVKKDGDYIETTGDAGKPARYADLIGTTTREAFWELARTTYPRDYVLYHDKLSQFCDFHFGGNTTTYVPRWERFNIPDELKGWVETELGNDDRPKSLWLVGPSRFGKTEWARSHGNHIYWNGSIDIGTYNANAKYAVFDDFNWEYLPFKKQFVGAQREFVVTDKYRKKQTIRWGKPLIILWNEDNDPWDKFHRQELEWYKANTIRVVLTIPLFEVENVWVEI